MDDAIVQLKTNARVRSVVRPRVAPFIASVVAHVNAVLLSFCRPSTSLATPTNVTAPPELDTVVAVFVWKLSSTMRSAGAAFHSLMTVVEAATEIGRKLSY